MKISVIGKKCPQLKEMLQKENITIYPPEEADMIIVYGGDGSLLGAERVYPGVLKYPIRDSETAPLCPLHSLEKQFPLFLENKLERTTLPKLMATIDGSEKLYAINDIFFGDDLASKEELSLLINRHPTAITFRMKPEIEGDVMDWLLGRELRQIQKDLPEIIRSHFNDPESIYKRGNVDGVSEDIKRGDVLMCKADLLRYAGEVQLARKDLPADPSIGRIGRIIDKDLPLLESFKTGGSFMLINEK